MDEKSIDVILTSPFYNTNKKQGKANTLLNTNMNGQPYIRYDMHIDDMTDEEYCNYTYELFELFDKILKENGVVLYNMSYGNNNRNGMIKAVNTIITKTNFTLADIIC